MTMLCAIGLMSGTSLDGIDVAAVTTDGESIVTAGPSAYFPYSEHEVALLRRSLKEARALTDRAARPGILAEAEELVTARHETAIRAFMRANKLDSKTVDVVGFHGQTVLHRPGEGLTVQIGEGQRLARALGMPLVHDFRAADVGAGGQGAPLVPVYHQALTRQLAWPGPICVLNVGGVANVTYIDDETLLAADVGPGNALIDDFMAIRTGVPVDRDGAMAAAGRVREDILSDLLRHPYFQMALPKSLDRNAFKTWLGRAAELTTADGAATFTALTAAVAAKVVALLPKAPRCWLVAGGGARNPTLMRMLAQRLAPASVESVETVAWSADALEAQAFAYLAVRSLRGLPITFPGTTGVAKPMSGGVLVNP